MNSARTYCYWLLFALAGGLVFADGGSGIKWAPDLASAKQASAQFKVPLMIHFYGDSCLPCRTLEKNVFTNAEVTQILNKYFICVSINGSRDLKTMSDYGVHSYPTDVFVSPDGEVLHQGVSPQELRNYLGILENVAVRNRDRNVALAAKQSASQSGTSGQQTLSPSGTAPLVASNSGAVPGLPPATAMGIQSNESGNTFYAPPVSTNSHPTLVQGKSANSEVQSGPLMPSQQPSSIVGSTVAPALQPQATVGQIAGAVPTFSGAPFPPLSGTALETYKPLPGLNGSTAGSTAVLDQLAAKSSIPGAELPTAGNSQASSTAAQLVNAAQPSANWNVAAGSTNVLTTENPHFTTAAAPTNVNVPAAPVNPVAKTAPTQSVPMQTIPAQTVTATTKAVPEQKPAIDGYCPVSLRAKQWKTGDGRFAVKHRGQIYLMANQACMDAFLRSPDHFAPVLMGNDPMILLTEGRLVPGSVQYGLFEDKVGPIFFATAESKAQFLGDFDRNMAAIDTILGRAATLR